MADFFYRVTQAMPLAAVVAEGTAAEMAAWLNARLGQNTVPGDLGPPLSPTGEEPATHHWCSAGWIEEDARSMLGHLAELGGIEAPSNPDWGNMTLAEQCAWCNETLHPAIFGNADGGVLMEDARGDIHPQDLLDLMGLQPVVPPMPEEEVAARPAPKPKPKRR